MSDKDENHKRYHLFVSNGHEHGGYVYKGSFFDLDETSPYINQKNVADGEIMECDSGGDLVVTYRLDTALSEYDLAIPVNVWREVKWEKYPAKVGALLPRKE